MCQQRIGRRSGGALFLRRSLAEFYRELGNANGDEIRFRVIRDGRTLLPGFVRSNA